MKKLIVIVATLLIAVSAHAQFGVIAGITSSKNNIGEAAKDVQNVTQYHVGLTYKLGIGNIFAIQPSIIYNVKGAKMGDIAGYQDFDYKNGYIEIPVQLQVGVGLGSLARIYGVAEPFIGYAISNAVNAQGGVNENAFKDLGNKLEYGFGLGVGIELIKHVQVSARYFWNLGSVNNANLDAAQQAVANQKANGIVASVALLF